jgi:multidrug resistance protein
MSRETDHTSIDRSLASLSDIEKGENIKDYEKDSDISIPKAEQTTLPADEIQPSPGNSSLKSEGDVEALPPPVLDWDGPDDPGNPMNWSLRWKIYHAAIPGLLCFAVTVGTSAYTPGVPWIMTAFKCTRTVALLPLTVYVLGLAFGPILSAPMSEMFGRQIVYLTTPPLFMLFTLGAGFSNSLASLIVCRFFAGFFGSPALAVGAGTQADIFLPRFRAKSTSIFILAPFFGPAIGPVIGGFAAQYKGWRWTQWCLLFLAVPIYLLLLPMQETYKKIILKRRAQKRGIAKPGNGPPILGMVMLVLTITLLRPIHMLYTEPIALLLSLYSAYTFGILFAFFAAFPYIFSAPPYLFTTSQTGLTFISIGIGVILGSTTALIMDWKVYQKRHTEAMARGETHVPPEQRLWAAMIGSIGMPVGLFWFAWSAGQGTHWAVPVVGAVWFGWGNMSLFVCTVLYLVDVYGPLNGASALAANGILRYCFGAVFPLFTVQMYTKLGTSWATSLLGFLSILLMPIPFVFYRWGPQIRKRSQYPTAM